MARILFVDDEAHVLEAIERKLRTRDHGILLATSAADAERILKLVEVDCVVSDENMPGVAGSEFLSRVRRAYPRVLRFMLTGMTSLEIAVRAVNDAAVHRFFQKPYSAGEILTEIETALASRVTDSGSTPASDEQPTS